MRKLEPLPPSSFDSSRPPSLSSSVPTVSRLPDVPMVTSFVSDSLVIACQAGGEALANAEGLVA